MAADFQPGKSLAGNIELDLAQGLSWVAWIKLKPRSIQGQTIFQAGPDPRADALELHLDEKNNLNFRAEDRLLTIPYEHAETYYNQWSMVGAYAALTDRDVKLEIELNNETQATSSAAYGGEFLLPRQIIGGGEAEFELSQLLVIDRVVTREERKQLLDKFRQEAP